MIALILPCSVHANDWMFNKFMDDGNLVKYVKTGTLENSIYYIESTGRRYFAIVGSLSTCKAASNESSEVLAVINKTAAYGTSKCTSDGVLGIEFNDWFTSAIIHEFIKSKSVSFQFMSGPKFTYSAIGFSKAYNHLISN